MKKYNPMFKKEVRNKVSNTLKRIGKNKKKYTYKSKKNKLSVSERMKKYNPMFLEVNKRKQSERNKMKFKGENNPNWKGRKTVDCIICNKKMILPINSKRKLCSRKCKLEHHSIMLSGENGPNWQGGLSFLPYPPEFNNRLKNKIKKRDNYTCQICNKKINNKRKLHAHHIDYDKNNNKENNLISLCEVCHSKTNNNRDYWSFFLQGKIND